MFQILKPLFKNNIVQFCLALLQFGDVPVAVLPAVPKAQTVSVYVAHPVNEEIHAGNLKIWKFFNFPKIR